MSDGRRRLDLLKSPKIPEWLPPSPADAEAAVDKCEAAPLQLPGEPRLAVPAPPPAAAKLVVLPPPTDLVESNAPAAPAAQEEIGRDLKIDVRLSKAAITNL